MRNFHLRNLITLASIVSIAHNEVIGDSARRALKFLNELSKQQILTKNRHDVIVSASTAFTTDKIDCVRCHSRYL